MSGPDPDRRRHRRFDMAGHGGKAVLVRRTDDQPELEECALMDLSYGGMRFRTHRPLRVGEAYEFLIGLEEPLMSAVVNARIRWVEPRAPLDWHLGAEFLESSTGWLGPEDDPAQDTA